MKSKYSCLFFLLLNLSFSLSATDCGLGVEIVDNSNIGTPSTITVNTAPGTQLGVDVVLGEVRLIVGHAKLSDIFIRLYSPNGDFVDLVAQETNGENFGDPNDSLCLAYTSFVSDFNATPIANGTAPYIGEYFPNQDFDVLDNGGSPLGDWTLVVWDLVADTVGSLEYWDFTLTDRPACQPPSEIFTEVFQDTIVYVSWQSNNNEILWNIEYDLAGFQQGNGINLSTTNDSLTLSGLQPNTAYELYIQSDCDTLLSSWEGPFSFVTACLPFEGDSLGGAILVSALPFTDSGTTAECFTDAIPAVLGVEAVYAFRMGSCADSVTVSLCGSDFDTSLFIYDSLGVELANNFDFCGQQSSLTMPVLPHTTYYAAIEGKGGASGDYQIEINANISIPVIDSYGAIPVSCYGASDGGIVFGTFGGSPPYRYFWETGATTGNANGLSAGIYHVTVVDNTGCEGVPVTVSLNEPDFFLIWANVTNETVPDADDGTIEVFVSGGVPPYEYLWDNGETTAFISGLEPNRYCTTITDYVGCKTVACRPTFAANPSAISGHPSRNFDVFPNPSYGRFFIEGEFENENSLELEVLNVMGQILFRQELAASFSLELESGTYFFKIDGSVKKVVVIE